VISKAKSTVDCVLTATPDRARWGWKDRARGGTPARFAPAFVYFHETARLQTPGTALFAILLREQCDDLESERVQRGDIIALLKRQHGLSLAIVSQPATDTR